MKPTITELPGIVIPEQPVTFPERITAGDYGFVHHLITESRYSLTLPAGPRNLVLAHFNTNTAGVVVESWADKNGFQPALLDDILAVGSHPEHRELPRQFPIVQLGTIAQVRGGRRLIPYLYKNCDKLGLCVGFSRLEKGVWEDDFRFLLARK